MSSFEIERKTQRDRSENEAKKKEYKKNRVKGDEIIFRKGETEVSLNKIRMKTLFTK